MSIRESSATGAAARPLFSGRLTANHISDHYDQFAWAYRFWWGDHIHHGLFRDGTEKAEQAQELLLRFCAAQAKIEPGIRVADVGCGHGGTARFLAREYQCEVLGLTISETQCKLAQKLSKALNGRAKFKHANAETYSFPAAAFEVIWNMESSEHFFDKPGYLRKAAEALAPGGRLMIAAWTGSMEKTAVREIAGVFLCPELWTSAQYKAGLEAAGLRVISCDEIGAEVAHTWEICAEQVRRAGSLIDFLPQRFRDFALGIELMRRGYQAGELQYSVIVACKQ